FENFLLTPNQGPIYFYGRLGQHAGNKYYGLGMEARELFTCRQMAFGLIFDLFRQPRFLAFKDCRTFTEIGSEDELESGSFELGLDYPEDQLKKSIWGSRISGTFQYRPLKAKNFFLNLEAGYKTGGFVMGETLKKAPIVKGGLSGQF
ncbi:MAG: hypothetical protein WC371_00135, partial [Parachlamydiales bacterium]